MAGAAQTTLRGQVGNLRSIGALERYVRSGMPYTVENELTDVGRGILAVADSVEGWLSQAPHGPIAFGSESAKGAIRALVAGWGSTILRALAVRPLSLTELDGVISDMSYPSLERRLSAMRAVRQVEVVPSEASQAKPYAVTEWARRAVGPLVAAGRCECEYFSGQAESLTRIDIEAAFLLVMPLVELSGSPSGSCLLGIAGREDDEREERLVGVRVEVQGGKVASCVVTHERQSGALAMGSVESWAAAILEGRLDGLRLEGDERRLAQALVERAHLTLS